ncbi:MAG: HD domain-containing protein [Patescibacteria group bacterium]|nr:HD domain-containing protein [Patescibacteria group bacterium]
MNKLHLKDRVYGEVEIKEPVILDLINSPSLQRLKDVDQAGYQPLWVNPNVDVGEYDHSRFAHSLGVYLLLKKYKASLEEQIAGLIHDVSHSAFSHCIDYVLDSGLETEQNHQDHIFDNYVKNSEIPSILKRYDIDVEYILSEKNFPLKENKLPDICADRIDYSLRTACIFGEIKSAKYFLDNLIAENQHWIFKNYESARKYAELFLIMNTKYYTPLLSAVMFQTVGDYLKHSLLRGYISEDDLYTTDKIVLSKIEPHHQNDKKLKLFFDRMNKRIDFENNPKDFYASILCKSRVIDPLCKYKEMIKRVSKIDKNWAHVVATESKPKQYFLKFAN